MVQEPGIDCHAQYYLQKLNKNRRFKDERERGFFKIGDQGIPGKERKGKRKTWWYISTQSIITQLLKQ